MLLDRSVSVSLAGRSRELPRYEAFPINRVGLAALAGLCSPKGTAFGFLHTPSDQTLRFDCNLGIEPRSTASEAVALPLGESRTHFDVLVQLLHHLPATEYNTPSTFRLAGYSVMLLDSVPSD